MAPKRPRITPRKTPTQSRAKETVEAILQAATHVLRKVGYDAMTTNQIAARAGVNIASVYQYFPNKSAIVVALMRRHAEEVETVRAPGGSDVRAMVAAIAAEHAVDPELHAIVATLGPRLGFVAADAAADDERKRRIARMKGAVPNPELALWIAETAIHAVVRAAFAERPDIAAKPILVDELVRLVTPFLEPSGSGGSSAGSRRGRSRARRDVTRS